MTLSQPHDVEVNESRPAESFLLPNQNASARPSSTRPGSQEETESPHQDVSESQIYNDEAIDESQNAVHTGQHYTMPLDTYFKPHLDDGTAHGTTIKRFNELVIEAATKIGRDFHCTSNYAKWFQEVGFEEVVENKVAWRVGTWPKGKKQKTMGMWMLTNALEGAPAIGLALLTRVLGMSSDEVELLLANLKKDIKDRSIHSSFPVYVVYGRKSL